MDKVRSAEQVIIPKMHDTYQGDRESAVTDSQIPVMIGGPLLTRSADSPSQIPSYPTRSLNFLKALHRTGGNAEEVHETNNLNPSSLALNVLVVGAGLGGLAVGIALARKGHAVTIFEQAPQMGEVGNSETRLANVIANSMVDWCRHTNTAQF